MQVCWKYAACAISITAAAPRFTLSRTHTLALPTLALFSFAKVVEGCEPFEISRLFLASLQLANSGNIDLGRKAPTDEDGGLCSLHELQFKLLSDTNAHETFQENHAASVSAPIAKAGGTPKKRATRRRAPLGARN